MMFDQTMKKSQILVLILLLATGHGVHAAVPKEEHWLEYNNPYNDLIFEDNDSIRLLGDSFQQFINQKDEYGNTLLSRAVKENNISRVKNSIEFGADVNAQNETGNTSLHDAADQDGDEIIQLLVAAGANVNQQDVYGYTPLHLAAFESNSKAIKLLIAAGADLNKKNKQGGTPLYDAVNQNQIEAIRLLILAGANTKIKDYDGQFIRDPLIHAIFNEALRLRNGSLKRSNDLDGNDTDSDCFKSKRRKP